MNCIAMHRADTCNADARTNRCINAVEFPCYRKLLRISRVARITNEEVLARVNEPPRMLNIRQQHKLDLSGHLDLVRGQGLEKKIYSERERERGEREGERGGEIVSGRECERERERERETSSFVQMTILSAK